MKADIGRRIKIIRNILNLTQKEFANALHIDDSNVRKWESGKVLPNAEKLLIMKEKFKININWLLTGEGEMFIKEEEKIEDKERDYKKEILEILEREDEEKVKALAEFLKRAWASQEQLSLEKSSEKIKTEKK